MGHDGLDGDEAAGVTSAPGLLPPRGLLAFADARGTMAVWALLRLGIGSACVAPAGAQEIRDFNTDTPGKSYTPYTVAQGYFQVESDSFHIIEMGNTQIIETLDPVFKFGLSSDLELDLQTTFLLNMQTVQGSRTISQTGFGDVVPGLKWNVIGNDRGAFSAALKFGVKLPTASAGLGNGGVEYYLVAPSQVALPAGFSLQLQEEVDVLKNANGTGRNFNYSEDVALGRSFGKISVEADAFAESATDANFHALYTADIGVGYSLSPAAILTFGTYFGLNRYAPSIEAYTSFGFRF